MGVLHQLYDEARMGLDEIPVHRQFVGLLLMKFASNRTLSMTTIPLEQLVMPTSALFLLDNFPTAGITFVSLFDMLWTAVEHLERCDFTVVFQTADRSSPN